MAANPIQLAFYTVENLFCPEIWVGFFKTMEGILETRLTRLDHNDPPRREVRTAEEAANYICSTNLDEHLRWFSGCFGDNGVDIVLYLMALEIDESNDVYLYIQTGSHRPLDHMERIARAFEAGLRILRPFYAACDFESERTKKKKHNNYATHYETELPGVFWLTYFNQAYVNFIGREKFAKLPLVPVEDDGGVLIRLGERPDSDDFSVSRDQAKEILGRDHFVDPQSPIDKPVGLHALSYETLRKQAG